MEPHLLIQRNGRLFLLVRHTDRFHIVTVNKNLDAEIEERLLEVGCDEVFLDDAKLDCETVMHKALRGVAVGGNTAGAVIVLYTKEKKLKYELSDDYSEEEIDAVFVGIERFQAPKKGSGKSGKSDWRATMQNESTQFVVELVGFVFNAIGWACLAGTMLFGERSMLWAVVCLLAMASSAVLYIVFHQYFSIMGAKEYKRAGYTSRVIHMHWAILAPAFALVWRGLSDFEIFNWTPLLVGGLILGIAISVGMYIGARELRENTSLMVVVVLVAVFASVGILGQVNHYADLDPEEPQICVVTDMDRTNYNRADNFYCTVVLASGDEVKLEIDMVEYSHLQPGDTVTVYVGQGALGIEYAYYIEKTE